MITFSPNNSILKLTNGQMATLATLYALTPDLDLEIVEMEQHEAIEVYVGDPFQDGHHRYYVNSEGRVPSGAAETCTRDGDSWDWGTDSIPLPVVDSLRPWIATVKQGRITHEVNGYAPSLDRAEEIIKTEFGALLGRTHRYIGVRWDVEKEEMQREQQK